MQHERVDVKPIIVGRKIEKTFRIGENWLRVLDRVNITVPTGQFVGVMGPSGSGKSTLLYLLGGLDKANGGQISVMGRTINAMNGSELARFRRETVGFIFQAFHLVPTLTALENVALPGIFAGVAREVRERRAVQLLRALGMGDRMDHRPSQLSGGQQQRVAIARALFNNPPIIMADEPTGALDSKTGQTVMKLLRWLCSEHGKTIVIVTHDPGIEAYADRLVKLRDGRVESDSAALDAPPEASPLPRGEHREQPFHPN